MVNSCALTYHQLETSSKVVFVKLSAAEGSLVKRKSPLKMEMNRWIDVGKATFILIAALNLGIACSNAPKK